MNSKEKGQRKTRSKTKFEFWLLSKNLIGKFSVGLEMAREKESVISKRIEQNEKENSNPIDYF